MDKFKKCMLGYILTFTIILGLTPYGVIISYAEGEQDFEYTSYLSGNRITKYKGNAASVLIPESIDGKSVVAIAESAFADCTAIESIVIPDSVTSIGDSAFQGCSNLKSITVPNSVITIGKSVFKYCASLNNVEIPSKVTYIADEVFCGCTGLKNIVIPSKVTSIGNKAFSGCESLENIEIPNSVTSMGTAAFLGCLNLKSAVISNGITDIMSETFKNCSMLKNIEIPNTITYIGDNAFYNCDGLTDIAIPESVRTIGEGTFSDCDNLENVIIQNADIYANTEKPAFSGSNNVKLYGAKGSRIEEYALACEIPFFPLISISSISLNKNSLNMQIGTTEKLLATVLPNDASKKEIKWVSNKPDTVSVDEEGNVFALKTGMATITVSSIDGSGKRAACLVTVSEDDPNTDPEPNPNPTPTPTPTPDGVAVSSIILNPVSMYLKKGDSSTIQTFILPDAATNKALSWSSSNTKVATVDANGVITAVGYGRAFVKAEAVDGSGKYASCAVIVAEETVHVPEISLEEELKDFSMEINKYELSLKKNATSNLVVSVSPDSEANRVVTWSTSNKNVATVDANGKVTAVGAGNATITATSKKFAEYNMSVSCVVTVTEDKKEVAKLTSGNVTLKATSAIYKGKAVNMGVTVKYGTKTLKKGTDYTVSYKNNKKVGKATVTVKGKGNYTGTVNKTFKILPRKQTIKKLAAVKKGFKVTYTGRGASEASGYQIRYCASKVVLLRTKAVSVKSYKTAVKTIKKLEPNKKYYVQVRTYKNVGTNTYYGEWSDIMYVTTLK